ncbi:MAG: aldo/keto reductase [Pseudomonadota bacterium]
MSLDATQTVTLPGGETVPAFGVGTWRMGEDTRQRDNEIDALKFALDRDVRLIDTAEMYGEGGAEEIVGAALAQRRDEVFLVSKVYPHNASFEGVRAACERSLARLNTDRIDLYLLHWPGSIPLVETVEGFEALVDAGLIRHWGVSNFDADDMSALLGTPGGEKCQANQVLYHLGARGVEFDLVPAARTGVPLMAYAPLGQGDLLVEPVLEDIAVRYGVSPAAVALAWTMRDGRTITIPKSASLSHMKENLAARGLTLKPNDLAQLDAVFLPPSGPEPLGII